VTTDDEGGDVSAGWIAATIRDCLDTSHRDGSAVVPTTNYRSSGRYPVVDQGAKLIAGWTDDDSVVIRDGLPLIVFGDHTRALKYVDFPFARGADGTQLLRSKPTVDTRFFYYGCRAVNLPSRGYNRHFTILREQEIRLPLSVEEQRTIASALRLVEDAVAVEVAVLTERKSLRAAVMDQVFSRGLHDAPRKESIVGDIPQHWDVVTFGELRESLRYGTSTRAASSRATYPVLRIPNIRSARVDTAELKYAELSSDDADRFELRHGDVLFIRTNGVIDRLGTCAVYHGDPEKAVFASYLVRARMKADVVPDYVAYYFGSRVGTRVVTSRATPAADGKYNLNTGIIDSLEVALPPKDEQDEIVALLSTVDRRIELDEAKRTMLSELFDVLLHGLMDGEIDASSLLVDGDTEMAEPVLTVRSAK
jgi:type I restriction enzyme, S subunit